MMGCQTGGQDRLFYSFNLDEHIPQNHLLRGIERCLDLSELRQHLADYYSHTGRPSIDPELMIRMLIVGYCYGIRSERRLCEEVGTLGTDHGLSGADGHHLQIDQYLHAISAFVETRNCFSYFPLR